MSPVLKKIIKIVKLSINANIYPLKPKETHNLMIFVNSPNKNNNNRKEEESRILSRLKPLRRLKMASIYPLRPVAASWYLSKRISALYKLLLLTFIQNVFKNWLFSIIFKNRLLKTDFILIILATIFDQIWILRFYIDPLVPL